MRAMRYMRTLEALLVRSDRVADLIKVGLLELRLERLLPVLVLQRGNECLLISLCADDRSTNSRANRSAIALPSGVSGPDTILAVGPFSPLAFLPLLSSLGAARFIVSVGLKSQRLSFCCAPRIPRNDFQENV